MIENWGEVNPDLGIPVLLYVCVNTMNYSNVLLGSLALRTPFMGWHALKPLSLSTYFTTYTIKVLHSITLQVVILPYASLWSAILPDACPTAITVRPF